MSRNLRLYGRLLSQIIVAVLAISAAPGASAQLFVSDTATVSGSINEYSLSGAPIAVPLISGFQEGPGVMTTDGHGDIYVINGASTVGEYTTSGAVVNADLISDLAGPVGLAVDSSGHLFVTTPGGIAEYSTSGALINSALITGLNGPSWLAVSGNDLFVVNNGSDKIGEYTTSGATVNASLITGLQGPGAIALDGNGDLFVANFLGSSVGEYTTSGATINASLITYKTQPALLNPVSLALDGQGDLYVGTLGTPPPGKIQPAVEEFTTSGQLINSDLVPGIDAYGLLVVTPEPSSDLLMAVGAATLFQFRRGKGWAAD